MRSRLLNHVDAKSIHPLLSPAHWETMQRWERLMLSRLQRPFEKGWTHLGAFKGPSDPAFPFYRHKSVMLNTLVAGREHASEGSPLVLLHGYASGVAK